MSEFSGIFDKYRPSSSSPGGFYTPQLYNYEEQEDEDNGVQSSDYFYRFMQGNASLGQGIGYLLKKAGADSVGQTLQDAGESAVDYWGQKISKEAQRIGQTEYTSGDLSAGDFARKAALDTASSLLSIVAGMGAGGAISKGVTFLVPKVPSIAAGVLGYSTAEGAIGSGQSGANVESYIKNAKHTDLMQHPDYKATYLSFLDKGMNEQESEAQTRKIAMDAAAGQASAETFITTALLSAPMGALVGKFASGIPLHTTRARAIGTGMTGEAAQEFGQSGTEQIAQNRAIRDYADPNRELTKGALEAAVGGAVGGGLMGGLLGTRTPLESPEQRRDESPPESLLPPQGAAGSGGGPGTGTPQNDPHDLIGTTGDVGSDLFTKTIQARQQAEVQGADPLDQTLAAGRGLLGGVAEIRKSPPEQVQAPKEPEKKQIPVGERSFQDLANDDRWLRESGLSAQLPQEEEDRTEFKPGSLQLAGSRKPAPKPAEAATPAAPFEYADNIASREEDAGIPESRMGGARSPEPPQADYEGIQLDEDETPAKLQDKTKLQPDKHLERRNQLERMKERTSQALNAYQLEVDKLKAAASNFGGEQAAPELDPDPTPGLQQATEEQYKSDMERVKAIPDQEQQSAEKLAVERAMGRLSRNKARSIESDLAPGPQQAIEDRYETAMERVNAIPDQEQPKPAQEQQGEAKPQSVMDRLANLPEVRHTVNTGKNKGKEIVGVVDKEITKEEAQAIDKYAFRHKDGGWFIRKDRITAPAEEDNPQLSSSGKPFATEREAGAAAKSRENRTGVRPEVVPVEGGFGLKARTIPESEAKEPESVTKAPEPATPTTRLGEIGRKIKENGGTLEGAPEPTHYVTDNTGMVRAFTDEGRAEKTRSILESQGKEPKVTTERPSSMGQIGVWSGTGLGIEDGKDVADRELPTSKVVDQIPEKVSDKPFGDVPVEDETNYYGSKITVKIQTGDGEFKNVPATVHSVINNGKLVEAETEINDNKVVFRFRPEQIASVDEVVYNKQPQADIQKTEPSAKKAPSVSWENENDPNHPDYKPKLFGEDAESFMRRQYGSNELPAKVKAQLSAIKAEAPVHPEAAKPQAPEAPASTVTLSQSGAPFTEKEAQISATIKQNKDRLSEYKVVPVEGGFGIQKTPVDVHQNEAGGEAEPVTPTVIKEHLTEAANNTSLSMKAKGSEGRASRADYGRMKAWLQDQIDAKIPEAHDSLAEAEQSDTKHVVFDVPGDGRFKILNTKERLTEFKKQTDKAFVYSSDKSKRPTVKTSLTDNEASTFINDLLDEGDLHNAIVTDAVRGNKHIFFYKSGEGTAEALGTVVDEQNIEGLDLVVTKGFGAASKGSSKGSKNSFPYVVSAKESAVLIAAGKTQKEALIKAKELLKNRASKAIEKDKNKAVSQDELREQFKKKIGVVEEDQGEVRTETQEAKEPEAKESAVQEDKTKEPEKSVNKSSVNVLRKAAESLDKKADAELGKDRRTHTRRMAAQASSAINSANRQKEKAQTIRTVADHVESNPGSPLRAIKSVQDLDYIAGLVSPSRLERNGAPKNLFDHRYNASNQAFSEDVIKEDASTDELIKHVKKKETSVPSDWMKAVEKHLSENRNAKLAERIRRYSNTETGDNNFVSMAPIEDVEQLESALTKADPSVRRRIFGEDVLERIKDRKRRDRLGLGDDSNAKAMAKAYLELVRKKNTVEREETETEKKLKDSELRGKYKGTEFFNTPEKIARQVVSSADIETGMTVLEPSAGIGHLAKAVAENTDKANIDVVELVPEFQSRLEKEGFNVIGSDFLELSPETHTKRYDRIVMNPPFSKDQDIAHIKHAFKFLKPGGRLVSIASSMAGERQNNANKDFKNWIEDLGGTQEMLPEAAFKDAINSTGVSTKMIVVDAPESVKPLYSSQPRPSGFKSISRKELESAISPILKELGQTVKIVDSIADLPGEVRAGAQGLVNLGKIVPGVWHDGTYYAVVDQTQSAAMAVRTALHELVGHKGVLGVLGKDATAVLADIAKSIPADMRDQLIEDYTREDGTKPGEVELGAEYVARLAERNQRPGIVARAVSAIRSYLRKWFPQISWSKEDVLALLDRSRVYLKSQAIGSNESGALFSSKKKRVVDSYARMTMQMLATEDEVFQTPRSEKKDLAGIAKDVNQEIEVEENQSPKERWDERPIAKEWKVTMPDGSEATVTEDKQGNVWINAAFFEVGKSGGTKLYSIVGNYAFNNDKIFIGDPDGLSNAGLFRRTENMLSLALKYGTTKFMRPHIRQEMPDNGMEDIAREVNWGDNDEENLMELLETSYHNIITLIPEIKNVVYSTENQRFETLEGAPFAEHQFRRMAKDAYGRYRGRISEASERSGDGEGVGGMLYGSTALKRANLIHSVVRRATQAERGYYVSEFGAQLSGGLSSELKKILYNSVTPRSIEESINAASESRLDRAKDTLFDNKLTEGAKRAALGTLTLRQLADIGKRSLPQIKKYVDVVNQMLTKRNQLAERAANKIDKWQAWATKNRPENEKLVDVMHEATIAGVDPAEDFVELGPILAQRIAFLERRILATHGGRDSATGKAMYDELKELRRMRRAEPGRKLKHGELQKKWFELTQEAKDIYIEIRNEHKERRELFKDIILGRLESAKLANKDRKELLNAMKFRFELQDKQAPYFPLVRFGKYWVEAADKATGELVSLRQETEREQRRVIENLEKDGHSVLKSGLDADHNWDLGGVSMGFVTDLIGQLDDIKMADDKRQEVADAIYQSYLKSLVDRSMRKQNIHRKAIRGWDQDAIRGFADVTMKNSYQLARMGVMDKLSEQMESMRKDTKTGDPGARRLYNEMIKRHQWVMNPTNSPLSQSITSVGFLWMLGLSPASALINLTQTMTVGVPVLASKFKEAGFSGVASELAKAAKIFKIKDGRLDTSQLTADEQAAMKAWSDSGLLDTTRTHDLAGLSEQGGYNYNSTAHKTMQVVASLFHRAEQFNREVTALAAFRLARKNNSQATAVRMAAELTWKSHFDYSNTNRSRYMQNDFMKVATQFKQFSQNMTYYLLRNLHQSVKGATKVEKQEARRQLVGTLAITGAIGGISALPLAGLWALANAIFGDDDEPFDAEAETKAYLAKLMGKDAANWMIYGALGAGISPRVSLNGLWYRDASQELEGESLWSWYAQQAVGPVLGGVLPDAMEGLGLMADGQIGRGMEKILPKFSKDLLKAYRYSEEDARTRKGALVAEIDGWGIAAQAMGFTPSEITERYQEISAIKGYEQHIIDRRETLKNRFFMARRDGDREEMQEIRKQIRTFNSKYRGSKIQLTPESLERSWRQHIRRVKEVGAQEGLSLRPSLKKLATQLDWAS